MTYDNSPQPYLPPRPPIVRSHRAAVREADSIVANTDLAVLRTQARAAESAAKVRGAEYLGEEVMTSLDHLRRHEARAAADDPIVAHEYAAVRRAVLYNGLNEIDRFGRSW